MNGPRPTPTILEFTSGRIVEMTDSHTASLAERFSMSRLTWRCRPKQSTPTQTRQLLGIIAKIWLNPWTQACWYKTLRGPLDLER